MKVKNKTIKFVVFLWCLFTPFMAAAELPCWNDASLAQGTGGVFGNNNLDFNQKYTLKEAEPVNLLTGNFDYETADFNIPSRGMPFEFTRFYNSLDMYDGPLGPGWSHSYNIALVETSDNTNTYILKKDPSGNKEIFTLKSGGNFEPPKGSFDALIKYETRYVLTKKDGTTFEFDLSGKLQSITDRNSNSAVLTYDSNGLLINIRDSSNRNIVLSYNSSKKISAITDFTGRSIKYAYDSNLNLSVVTFPATADYPQGTTETYAYDQNHRLLSIKDATGNEFLANRYDDVTGRVYWQKYGESGFTFRYDSVQLITSLTDRNGNTTQWQLNDDGTAASKLIGVYLTRYYYDDNKNIIKIIYPKGNLIENNYDIKGNIIKITQRPKQGSSEQPIISEMSYEPRFNRIKSLKDPNGNVVIYLYDYDNPDYNSVCGNLMRITYPQAIEANFTYNNYGQPQSIVDPNGNTTKYEYATDTGYPVKVISGFGSLNYISEMSYDALGNLINSKDPKGNIAVFDYDSHRNRIRITQPAPFNYVTNLKYDQNDKLIQVNRQIESDVQALKYSYNNIGNVISAEDGLENKTYFTYDGNDNKASVKDVNGNIISYEYDSRNLLSKTTDAEGKETQYFYGENANLALIRDAKGNETCYEYDDFDRLIRVIYADGSSETYTYDQNSNIKSKTSAKGEIISYDYDSLNRLILKTFPDNKTVTYVYDKASRLKEITDENGVTRFEYDALNRINRIIYPGGKTISYEYDANSNRTKLVYPDTSFITYEYDQLNRLSAIKNQAGALISSCIYDALSRRKELDYGNNTKTAYSYDLGNRILNLENKTTAGTQISQFSYTYDNVGNRLSMDTLGGLHQYDYDKKYQLKNADYPQGYSFSDTQFSYDALGNRTQGLSSQGTVPYTTNNLNQYTRVGPSGLSYDSNGDLTSDGTFAYNYDHENRLVSTVKPGTSVSYKYDSFGRRIEKSVNGSTTKFLYDGDRIIAEYDNTDNLIKKFIYGSGIDEVLQGLSPQGAVPEWYYQYDGLGSVTNLTNSAGIAVESYSYDAFGNSNTTSTIGNTRMFTGREYDAETGLYYYRARYYSSNIGRFLQRDPIGYTAGMNLYAYVGNNSINAIDPLGLYTLIIHGRGHHDPGYSGAIGEALRSNGETTKEVIWSGDIFDSNAPIAIQNEIKQAAQIAEIRGEPLNIIGHSWGGVLAGSALRETHIKVDNFVTMGTPYGVLTRPGGVVRYANFISEGDIFGFLSIFSLTAKQIGVNSNFEDLFSVHNSYWNDPEVYSNILKMFGLDKEKKKCTRSQQGY